MCSLKKLIVIFIAIMLSIATNAQELKVKSITEATHDLSARTQARQDLNLVDCALLKVFVVGENVKFSGNVVGDVESKGNEYWVYLANGTKRVKVTHPDFLPLEVTFGDYGINEVNSKSTYVMILSNGSSGSNAAEDAGGQYLVLNVEPANAIVFIDDSEVTLQNGAYSKFLPYGSHSYKISDPLHTTESGSFDIGMEKKVVNIKLKPAYGVLQISTKPENGAKVYIDNDAEPIGVTPLTTKKLVKGEHNFRFQKQDYESLSLTHVVHDDGSTKPLIVNMSPNYAEVSISASSGCSILINGEEKGSGSWSGRLTDGMYRLEARKKGHKPTFQNITVVKGVSQTIKLSDPSPIYGSLNVTTNPIGAKIYIDNEEKGSTPDIVNNLLIGNHTIRLEIEGYDPETQNITIEEGKIKELAVNLNKKKEVYVEPKKVDTHKKESTTSSSWTILQTKSDSYLRDHDFINAIHYYELFMKEKPELSFEDYEGLANIYSKYGEADPSKKAEYLQKAVDIFRAAGQKYPIQQVYATYMAASNVNKLDDNMKNSLAKADYLKVIELLANKADRTKGDNTMLKTAYHYMMFNSYINKNVAGAKDYADKILEIDPEYKPALEIKNLK